MNNQNYITNSSEEAKALAKKFAKSITGRKFLAFYGNLGGGKTTFVQGLAKGLGINRRIISPTFIILRKYKMKKGNFYHIDLYRIDRLDQLESIGLDEIMNEENSVIVVEWAEKMTHLLPSKRIEIHFKFVDENKREISIKNYE